MKIIIGSHFFPALFVMLGIVRTNEGTLCEGVCSDLFLVRPGDGEEFVYSPFNVNATLHCAVNNTNLVWVVDSSLFLNNEVYRPILSSRGIFQSGDNTSSDGVTISSVTVFGNQKINNNTRICCQTIVNAILKVNCTMLTIYGMVY